MRNICKDCTLLKVCMTECKESKVYDIGYNDAIEKACEWLKNYNEEILPYTNLDCDGRSYVDMEEFAEEFRKAMKGE